jgi:hypothetical protein
MSGNATSLADLTARFLEREGAVVERIEPLGLEVLAPAAVQAALRLPELGRIGFGAELPGGAERVSIESDFVDRLTEMLGERGRFARVVVPADNPRPRSPERLVESALLLDNATCRFVSVDPEWTTYVIPTFRYVARSDDQREGVVSFALNAATSSLLDDFDDLLAAARNAPEGLTSPVPSAAPERIADVAARCLPERIEERLAPFFRGMARRLQRDANRLFDYYSRLRSESLSKLTRLATGAGDGGRNGSPGREELRLASIAREYAAKLEDLSERYALTVEVAWEQTIEIVLPVQRFKIEIRRRKRTRQLALDANAFTRRLEPPPCEYRCASDRLRVVCDDALHVVSRSGLAPCPACQRPACRVCNPQGCPRCGRGW